MANTTCSECMFWRRRRRRSARFARRGYGGDVGGGRLTLASSWPSRSPERHCWGPDACASVLGCGVLLARTGHRPVSLCISDADRSTDDVTWPQSDHFVT